MTQPNFYDLVSGPPQSSFNNTSLWGASTIGQLNKLTNEAVYINEIEKHNQDAPYSWRVTDAYYSTEDGVMSWFRALGVNGEHYPFAPFGVTWPDNEASIGGGFNYPPPGNKYYIPMENIFHTHNTGGYKVGVLDRNYPSEFLNFGMYDQGGQHQGLVITFRLFAKGFDGDYPNDIEVAIG